MHNKKKTSGLYTLLVKENMCNYAHVLKRSTKLAKTNNIQFYLFCCLQTKPLSSQAAAINTNETAKGYIMFCF